MRIDFARFLLGRRRLAPILAAVGLVALAAGPSEAQNVFQRLFGGGGGQTADKSPGKSPDVLIIDPTTPVLAYCPEIRVTVGGDAMATYDPAHDGEQKYVKYLSSITQTARECRAGTDPLAMNVKIGIAGRVVAGPLGKAGKVSLPLRVTVLKQHGGKVYFNKSYTTTVNLAAPNLSADFSDVIEPITFKRTADDEDLIVYVGFQTPDNARQNGL